MSDKRPSLLKSVLLIIGFFSAVAILLACGLILFPYWLFFTWVVDRVGTPWIRKKKDQLQTRVFFYEHKDFNRKLVLIGTIHIGEEEYFSALQNLIDSLPDHRVLYERVGKITPEEEAQLTEQEKLISQGFDYAMTFIGKSVKLLELQHQKDGLDYDNESWINTDTTMYQLIQSFARKGLVLIKRVPQRKSDGEFSETLDRWLGNKLLSRIIPLMVIVRLTTIFSSRRKLVEKIILDERNDIAVDGILDHISESNLISIWGAAHLKGMHKQLKAAGFKLTNRQWFTAYHVRRYSLLEPLKEHWRETKTWVEARSNHYRPKRLNASPRTNTRAYFIDLFDSLLISRYYNFRD